jgi:hypothetical protein
MTVSSIGARDGAAHADCLVKIRKAAASGGSFQEDMESLVSDGVESKMRVEFGRR